MTNFGYIALHRKIEDSFVYQDSGLLHLWVHCLIKASHTDRTIIFDGQSIDIKRGQFITGRKSLAKTLKSTEQKVRSRIALLQKHGKIVQKSTNKYSIISVVKYDYYQTDRNKITNTQPADNQQITTNNNGNNGNNGNNQLGETSSPHLEDNQNPMAWKQYNENSHGDDLPSIGDDGEIEIEKTTKVKRHYKEVYKIFKEVLSIEIPLNWTVNATQQKCADNLFAERGEKEIQKALEKYLTVKDQEFCPQISSPHDLDSKWDKLQSVKEQIKPASQVEASADIRL